MPRNVKESDSDMEQREGRKITRMSMNSILDSPLRRSSRIKPPATDSSSESNDASVRNTRRRTYGLDTIIPELTRNTRVRRNSAASDISEQTENDSATESGKRMTRRSIANLPTIDSPTKTQPRVRRTTRAGSETSTSPVGRVTRRTRASSMEPEVMEESKMKHNDTPMKSRRRASAVPSEPPVVEESELRIEKTVPEMDENESDTNESKSSRRKSKSDANNVEIRIELVDSLDLESEVDALEKLIRDNVETPSPSCNSNVSESRDETSARRRSVSSPVKRLTDETNFSQETSEKSESSEKILSSSSPSSSQEESVVSQEKKTDSVPEGEATRKEFGVDSECVVVIEPINVEKMTGLKKDTSYVSSDEITSSCVSRKSTNVEVENNSVDTQISVQESKNSSESKEFAKQIDIEEIIDVDSMDATEYFVLQRNKENEDEDEVQVLEISDTETVTDVRELSKKETVLSEVNENVKNQKTDQKTTTEEMNPEKEIREASPKKDESPEKLDKVEDKIDSVETEIESNESSKHEKNDSSSNEKSVFNESPRTIDRRISVEDKSPKKSESKKDEVDCEMVNVLKSSIVAESQSRTAEESSRLSEVEKAGLTNGKSPKKKSQEKSASQEISDFRVSESESESVACPSFKDIPAEEWSDREENEATNVEDDNRSIHSISTERNESESEIPLADKKPKNKKKHDSNAEKSKDGEREKMIEDAINEETPMEVSNDNIVEDKNPSKSLSKKRFSLHDLNVDKKESNKNSRRKSLPNMNESNQSSNSETTLSAKSFNNSSRSINTSQNEMGEDESKAKRKSLNNSSKILNSSKSEMDEDETKTKRKSLTNSKSNDVSVLEISKSEKRKSLNKSLNKSMVDSMNEESDLNTSKDKSFNKHHSDKETDDNKSLQNSSYSEIQEEVHKMLKNKKSIDKDKSVSETNFEQETDVNEESKKLIDFTKSVKNRKSTSNRNNSRLEVKSSDSESQEKNNSVKILNRSSKSQGERRSSLTEKSPKVDESSDSDAELQDLQVKLNESLKREPLNKLDEKEENSDSESEEEILNVSSKSERNRSISKELGKCYTGFELLDDFVDRISDDKSDDSSKSIDSDVANDMNLAGQSITHYSDDDVPADDCMATESESQDSEDDEGEDLKDFVVDDDDDEELEDEEDSSDEQETKKTRKRIVREPVNDSSDEEENDKQELDLKDESEEEFALEVENGGEEAAPQSEDEENEEEEEAAALENVYEEEEIAQESDDEENEISPESDDEAMLPVETPKKSSPVKVNSAKSATPKNKKRLDISIEENSEKLGNASAKSSAKKLKSQTLDTSTPKLTQNLLSEKFSAKTNNKSLKLENSISSLDKSVNKTPKMSSIASNESEKGLLQTSYYSVGSESPKKTPPSKLKSKKSQILSQSLVGPSTDSPEVRYLMKEKLNDSMPVLKLQRRSMEFRRSKLEQIEDVEVPEDEAEVKEKETIESENEIDESEKKKKRKKKKKKKDKKIDSSEITEESDELVESQESVEEPRKKLKKRKKKSNLEFEQIELSTEDNEKVEEPPKKMKKRKKDRAEEEIVEISESITKKKKKDKKEAKELKNKKSSLSEIVGATGSDSEPAKESKKKKKKLQERVSNVKETKTSVKRLPEDFLESLTEVVERPKKRRKVVKEEKELSKKKSNVQDNSLKNAKDENFISLSSFGATTSFEVVHLNESKKKPKKSALAKNFRERMLARNPRQPVSAYLMYQQKKQASGKNNY